MQNSLSIINNLCYLCRQIHNTTYNMAKKHKVDNKNEVVTVGDIQEFEVATCGHKHDRFLIIDDTVYLLGASVKDMGNGCVQ